MSDIEIRGLRYHRDMQGRWCDAAGPLKVDMHNMLDKIARLEAKCRLLEADLAFHVGYRQEVERGKLGDTDAR